MSIRRELSADEVLYRQGEPCGCAWLLESGQVELVSVHGRRTMRLGVLGAGELAGELGLLDGAPHGATATALGPCRLLAIERAQFIERLQAADPILRTFVDSLLQRTRGLEASLRADAATVADAVQAACTHGSGGATSAAEADPRRRGVDRIRLEAQLREALAAGTLEVRYQPVYELVARRVRGYEALVRWSLDGRPVSPSEFIQLAEETSLIMPVGDYVFDRAFELLQALRERGTDPLPTVAVNLSARQLAEPGMARRIAARVERARVPPGALGLEVTESRMLDYAPVAAAMAECRAHGLAFALDDFGTGYSNLAHLHALEFESVKVDQAFVQRMFESARAMRMLEAAVAMAHALDAKATCEGVETPAQLARLRELGVDRVQGYLIGQAVPAAAVLSGEAARIGEEAGRRETGDGRR